MGNTLRNTFPQCGKCWILSRKTKARDEGVTRKIGLIDHFVLGKLFLVVTLSDKVGCFGHSLLKPFVFLNVRLVIPIIVVRPQKIPIF